MRRFLEKLLEKYTIAIEILFFLSLIKIYKGITRYSHLKSEEERKCVSYSPDVTDRKWKVDEGGSARAPTEIANSST